MVRSVCRPQPVSVFVPPWGAAGRSMLLGMLRTCARSRLTPFHRPAGCPFTAKKQLFLPVPMPAVAAVREVGRNPTLQTCPMSQLNTA